MHLPKALRVWLAANHDILTADDRVLAADLAAEIERGEFAHLTTDLSVEQQLTIIALTEVEDRERVGHVFRSALHWHRFGSDETSGVAEPPIAGALPPPVPPAPASTTRARPFEGQPVEQQATQNQPAAPTQPGQVGQTQPRPRSQNRSGARVAALGIAMVLAMATVLLLSGGDEPERIAQVEPVPAPTVTPAIVTQPLPTPTPTPTTAPATQLGTEPTPTPSPSPTPSPTPTTNPTSQLDVGPDPTPTPTATRRLGAEPTPTANPATASQQADAAPLGDIVVLQQLEPSEPATIWTLTVPRGRILDLATTGPLPDGFRVIAFDVQLRPLGDQPAEQPVVNPRLIFVGGDSEQPNLGGGNFSCPADRGTWPQFAPQIDRETTGTMCFIESDADLASPRSRLLFAADAYESVAFSVQ